MGFVGLGRFLVNRRKFVLGLAAVFLVVAGAYSADVAKHLSAGGFLDPGSESVRGARYLSEQMGSGTPNLVIMVRAAKPGATVDDPALTAVGNEVTTRLAAESGVTQVASYWSLGKPPPLRSTSGDSALVIAHLQGSENEIDETAGRVIDRFDRADDVAIVQSSGLSAGYREAGKTIEGDLRLAELIALPLTLLLLLFVFRGLVAAMLPVLGGVFAIVGTFAVLKVLAGTTEVSIYALNLTTAMGLGLAIDYSLFVVSRYREERRKGLDEHAALIRTVATAGRAVVFSGLTVAVSLGALLVFPAAFLRSFAYAGIPVVGMAVVGAVIVLPALIAVLGDRLDALSVGRRAPAAPVLERSFWYRVATAVMKRPIVVAVSMMVLLLVLASPFLHLTPSLPDDRVLPPGAGARQVSDQLRAQYSSRETGALAVVLPGDRLADGTVDGYAAGLSKLPGVARVDARTGVFLNGAKVLPPGLVTQRFEARAGEWLSVVPNVEPVSAQAEDLVHLLRATPAPTPGALVAGPGAELADTKALVASRLPWVLAIVGGATLILLFLSFGSVLVPIKALVLNTLSLTATFGAMVWIFQDGHLSGVLGFTPTGMLDLSMPILMFCVAFGLSMDYEVFLLSRIKEEYDRTGDNVRSVAAGLARSGRIITAAAATISVVFLAFSTSSISFVKLFGIGLAMAVIVDATIIRTALVPAFMRLAGDANWWAPRWMRAVQRRANLAETEVDTAAAEAADTALDAIDLNGDRPRRREPAQR
jgi:putative drug exporter of the RND superfamily